jgi:hypothetical protein
VVGALTTEHVRPAARSGALGQPSPDGAGVRAEGPVELSVVVTVVGGQAFLPRCLRRLTEQMRGRAVEMIVPHDASAEGVSWLRREFPAARFLDLGCLTTAAPPGTRAAEHEVYDRRRAAGLAAARGAVVALIEDYELPAPDWCERVLEAHRQLPHAVIGGAVDHAGRGLLNLAVYLLDFGRYRPPLPEGPAEFLTDVNVSYKRAALEAVRPLWAERYHEVTVHWALARGGAVLWRRPAILVSQDRGPMVTWRLIAERVAWGRLFGRLRAREAGRLARLAYAVGSPLLPALLTARAVRHGLRSRRPGWRLFAALPAIGLLATAWAVGEFQSYVGLHDR